MENIELPHEPIVGFGPIMDEEECIRGWASNLRLFTDVQFAIIDPRSSDATVDILRDECPWVKICWQNVESGDSTKYNWGPSGELTYVREVNRFLHEMVPLNRWCVWLAGDERFDPRDQHKIRWMVDAATTYNADCLSFELVDVCPGEKTIIDYGGTKFTYLHKKFFQRTRRLKFHAGAHANEQGLYGVMKTRLNFYHFGMAKKGFKDFWWRGWDGSKTPGTREVAFENLFVDWREDGVKIVET